MEGSRGPSSPFLRHPLGPNSPCPILLLIDPPGKSWAELWSDVRATFRDPTAEAAELLGVPIDATAASVKSAHRKLAVQHHPDKVRTVAIAGARGRPRNPYGSRICPQPSLTGLIERPNAISLAGVGRPRGSQAFHAEAQLGKGGAVATYMPFPICTKVHPACCIWCLACYVRHATYTRCVLHVSLCMHVRAHAYEHVCAHSQVMLSPPSERRWGDTSSA